MRDLLKLPAMCAALITNAIVMIGWDLFNLYMPVYLRNIGFTAIITRVAIPPITARWGVQRMIAVALAIAAPHGRAAEGIAMRLAVSYGAHVFIPTMFGALGAAIGLAPIF